MLERLLAFAIVVAAIFGLAALANDDDAPLRPGPIEESAAPPRDVQTPARVVPAALDDDDEDDEEDDDEEKREKKKGRGKGRGD